MLTVNSFDHVVFNVHDVEASARWYENALGMKREVAQTKSGETRTSLTFGSNKINLRQADASQEKGFTGRAPTPGSDDLCFLTDISPDDVAGHFRAAGIEVEQGPVEKKGARGPICSVYVRDPDGNLIEVSSYI